MYSRLLTRASWSVALIAVCQIALAADPAPQPSPDQPVVQPAEPQPIRLHPDKAPPPGADPTTVLPLDGKVGKIEVSPQAFDFGDKWEGEKAEAQFTVKNTGEGPLTIQVRSTCGCTVPTQPKSPLQPGESSTFMIGFTTQGHPGKANKAVKVISNDPTNASVNIPVTGNVKPLVAMSPANQIRFNELSPTSEETQSIKLVNQYTQPVNLKLRDGQEFGKYKIELKTVKEGTEYELVATTVPPLSNGWNRASVILETGLADLPLITVGVYGNAQPLVLAAPSRLMVPDSQKQPSTVTVRVQYRAESPVKITEVTCDVPGVKTEIKDVPPATTQPVRLAFQHISVTLPAYDDIPEAGGKLVIHTDAKEDLYKTLEVDILRRTVTAAQQPGGNIDQAKVREEIEKRLRERGVQPPAQPQPDSGQPSDKG